MALRHAPLLLALTAPILLSGCVSGPEPLQVTYISDSPGALVVDSAGKVWGRAPVTLTYPGALVALQQGQCVHPWAITMHWPSGAQQTTNPVACPADGLNQQLVIERPKNAPRLDLDVQFAAAEEQARAARDAAAAQAQAEDAAATTEALAIINAETPRPSTPAPSPSIHCTSRTVGQGQYAHTTTDCN